MAKIEANSKAVQRMGILFMGLLLNKYPKPTPILVPIKAVSDRGAAHVYEFKTGTI